MILDMFRIDGKVAVITGGNKGIGHAITVALAEAGADVAVVSRSEDEKLSAEIQALGRRYFHHRADLSQRDDTQRVVPAVVQSWVQ